VQLALPLSLSRPVVEVHYRLLAAYGPPPEWVRLDPVSQLILSLLGSRTRGDVSKMVFHALCERFRDWESLRDAPLAAIEPLLRPVTFAEKKVVWLPAALRSITTRRGRLDLIFLVDWPVKAARGWLETLPGVGPKVSAAVVNFSTLRMRALVVDTHHLRVAKRLNLLPPATDAAVAHRLLMRQLPTDWTADDLDTHHTLMKLHGQRFCRHAAPICSPCPLRDLCAAR
jgi:endonuclease III